jgi:Tfp pilus assembly protein PilF
MNPRMRIWIPLLVLTLGCSGKAGQRQEETQDARPVDKAQDAKAFATRGNEKLDRGDLDGAVADYTGAIRLDPRSARAYNNRALALYRNG